MYQINSREFKRAMSLLATLGSKRHPHGCINDDTLIKVTVDLFGDFELETPNGMTFGSEMNDERPVYGAVSAYIKFAHLKVVKKSALVKNTIAFDVEESGLAVFTINDSLTYRFSTARLDFAV